MLKFIKSTASKIILVILVLLMTAFCYAFPHKVQTANNILKSYHYVMKGDKQYAKQDLVGAINYYQLALNLYPAHTKANYNLANIFAVYEDYISALDYYEKALKYNPKYMNARIALGILLSEKFYEYDRAIKEYQTAINLAPFNVNIPFIYNNTKFVSYNKSVAYYNMGLAYKWKSMVFGQDNLEIRKSLKNAAKSYKKAIKYNKNSYDSYFNLALSLHLLSDYEEAQKAYCKCLSMREFDYDVHYNLAILLREQNNYLDAILELEKAALIVDADSDGFKTRYIFDVLNETASKLYAQEEYSNLKERLNKDPIRSYTPTFVNGKIVASEELDKAIVKNMKTCSACENYKFD